MMLGFLSHSDLEIVLVAMWIVPLVACAPPERSAAAATAPDASQRPIPLTSSEVVRLSAVTPTTLSLPGGQQVTFSLGSGEAGALVAEQETTLPERLPQGSTFVSGLTVNVLRGGLAMSTLPAGATLTIKIPVPKAFSQRPLDVLFWDATYDGNLGGWVDLNRIAIAGGRVMKVPARTVDGGLEFTTNFPGTFILVAR